MSRFSTKSVEVSDPSTSSGVFPPHVKPPLFLLRAWMLGNGGKYDIWDGVDLSITDCDEYPFTDWTDLTDDQRYSLIIARTLSVWPTLDVAPHMIKSIVKSHDSDHMAATEAVFQMIESSMVLMGAPTVLKPTPARPGHLMAEGGLLAKAMDEKGYQRRVVFNVPVNQYTCLYGDSLAHGGDMITGVTVEDTKEEAYVQNGVTMVHYITKAIST